MMKPFALLTVICALAQGLAADVLIVADEFPAMKVLAKRLLAEDGLPSQLVDQADLPNALHNFSAVVVYIHRGLNESAERAFIQYAKQGGRLVLLHHSISSGKTQNREWFPFLGVELPAGGVERGGYKWIEGATPDWVNVAGDHFLMTNRIAYPKAADYKTASESSSRPYPCFELQDTEVYLNHVLTGQRRLLMGLRYTDAQTGTTWMQSTAGWLRSAEKGWVIYFMPGHTVADFEDRIYGRIVLNAISASRDVLR